MYRFKVNSGKTTTKTGEKIILDGVLFRTGEIALLEVSDYTGEDISVTTYVSLTDMLDKRGKCLINFLDPEGE